MDSSTQGVIHRYRAHLPLPADCRVITLHEGSTPLVRLEHLPRRLGLDAELYVKFEVLDADDTPDGDALAIYDIHLAGFRPAE